MLSFPSGVRLFVATTPTDMRKGFSGLSALVIGEFEMDPLAGDLFIFINRRGTQVRILFWDGDGYCFLAKRLERGTFRRLTDASGKRHLEIDAAELAMLLAGIDAREVSRRKRYQHPEPVLMAASA